MASGEVKIPLAMETRGRPFFDLNKDSRLSLKAVVIWKYPVLITRVAVHSI